jgi:hypothetical protein
VVILAVNKIKEMKQKLLNDGWKEHKDSELQRLEQGDALSGLLIEKSKSQKYNDCGIYQISVKDDPVPKVILGSKQLDKIMASIDVGTRITIIFKGTKPSDKGNPMKVFEVYTRDKNVQ